MYINAFEQIFFKPIKIGNVVAFPVILTVFYEQKDNQNDYAEQNVLLPKKLNGNGNGKFSPY